MASIVTGDGFDIKALAGQVEQSLPAYARPVFVRLQPAIDVTGTFKYRKMDLVEDAFDPARAKQPLYVLTPKGYQKVTRPVFDKVVSGELKV
jgi:fatty-acyl-CoA synthase